MLLHAAAHRTVTKVFLTDQVMQSHLYLTAVVLDLDLAPQSRLSVWSHYPIDCGVTPGSQNYPYCPCCLQVQAKPMERCHSAMPVCMSQVTVHVTYDHIMTPVSHTSTSDGSNWKRLETVKSENHR